MFQHKTLLTMDMGKIMHQATYNDLPLNHYHFEYQKATEFMIIPFLSGPFNRGM